MKKLLLVVFLFALFNGYSAYADFEGDYLANNNMEGEWSMFYDFGQTSTLSDEAAHSGSQSLKYSVDAADNFQVDTNPVEITGNEKLCYRLYVKNRPTAGVVIRAYTGDDTNAKIYSHDMVCTNVKDGWEEYSFVHTPEEGATRTMIYVQVTKSTPRELPVYFDDITIQKVPYRITLKDAVVNDSDTLKLDKLQLKGFNRQNEGKVLSNSSDCTSWTVISGAAVVDGDNNLFYTGDSTGTVTVEGSYLGVTAQAEITFVKNVSIALNGNSINVINNKSESIDVSVITALFDDNNMLYKCVINNQIVLTESKDIAIADIAKPYFINNNNLKVFVIADGDMKAFDVVR